MLWKYILNIRVIQIPQNSKELLSALEIKLWFSYSKLLYLTNKSTQDSLFQLSSRLDSNALSVKFFLIPVLEYDLNHT